MTEKPIEKKCDKCEKSYEPYHIFIRNNLVSLSLYLEAKKDYKNLCKDCRNEMARRQ